MIPKPLKIVDRDDEWSRLDRLWRSGRAEVVFVLGRRRVGKSFVLAPFSQAVDGIYYQATRRSEAEQLRALTGLVGERFRDPALIHGAPFERWESLLDYITARAAGEPFLVVLDEYPYLESSVPGLSTVLQSWIDHRLEGRAIKLVLCGSHVSAMKQLEGADQPLHARRTARIVFQAFPYFRAARFFPKLDARDRLIGYGVFGGVPGHLALVDPTADLETNVVEQMLDSSSRLFDEAQHVLDAFLGESEVHYSILAAIANGERTWRGITNRTGKSAGSLSRPMNWLIEMGLLRRTAPATEAKPGRSKRVLYSIIDPYISFWHRFVSPLIEAGLPASMSAARIWSERIVPGLNDYMGPVFEEAARSFVEHGGISSFQPLRVGSWWDARSRDEVDVVAISSDGELLLGECKWGRASSSDVRALQRRSLLVAKELGSHRRPQLVLFTGRGLADDGVRAAVANGEVRHVTADELLEGPVSTT
jgi:uncharacterized protein